jgi:hypothetical protein
MTRCFGFAIVFTVGLLQSISVSAATFCVVGNGLQPQCLYDDAASCNRNADSPNFICTVNPEAQLTYIGGQKYCIVDSNRVAQCLYDDHARCDNDARERNFVCVDHQAIEKDNINPFRYDPRSQN